MKSAGLAYVFWVLLGPIGGHRFYVGRVYTGLAWAGAFLALVAGYARRGLPDVALWGLAGALGGVWLIDAFRLPRWVEDVNSGKFVNRAARHLRALIDLTPLGRTRVGHVALHMIAEGIRMKVALVFLALIAMIVLALPFTVEGDGSLTGAVQSYLSFSLGFTGFFLGILTIFLSRSISDELTHRQVFIVMSKPVARWEYILGKWVGITLFNLAFLSSGALMIYGMTHYVIATKPPIDDAFSVSDAAENVRVAQEKLSDDQTEPSDEAPTPEETSVDRQRLETEVLVARHATRFTPPDFRQPAAAEFEQRLEQGFYAERGIEVNREREIARLTEKHEAQWRIIPPRSQRFFYFEKILCDRSPDQEIQLRYKAEVLEPPKDEIFRCLWFFGDPDKGIKPYEVWTRHVVGRFHTVKVPADCVASDGTLLVWLVNVNPYADPRLPNPEPPYPCALEITQTDGVTCLFVVGSFEGNLLRLFCLIFFKLMFLGAAAVLMTSLLSFPVACLASFALFALAHLRPFVEEALDLMDVDKAISVAAFVKTMTWILKAVPRFSYYDGVETFVNGQNVPLTWVLQGFGELAVIQAGIMIGLAMLVFHRRELAEVSI